MITAMAMHLGWQMARALLLYWTGWNFSVNLSRRDCDLWMSPHWEQDTPKCL